MKKNLLTSVWAGLLLCAAGITTAQANTLITFSVDMATNIANASFIPGTDNVSVFGTFNGWASPGLVLAQSGSSTVYTNSYDDTGDANGHVVSYRFLVNGNAEPLSCYDNRAARLPATSGASLALPTPFYGGNGPVVSTIVKFQVDMSEEIQLGNFNPGLGHTVVVAGSFNGWSPSAGSQYVLTNDPSILVTNYNFIPPVVKSNVFTAAVLVTTCANGGAGSGGLSVTNENQEWKFVQMPGGNWENPGPANADDASNRFFTQNTNQVLPLVDFSDTPYAPLATVTFKVDMSTIALYDANYVPNSISAWGSFNGWSGPVTMTNNLAAPNTNLYSATVTMGEGTPYVLQYRYTNSFLAGWVYDYGQDGGPNWVNNNNYRRIINLPITSTVLVTNFPAVYFNDLAPNDVLPVATPVLFSVDMNGAIGTDAHVFVPGSDGVYINGIFAGATPSQPNGGIPQRWYDWSGGVNPITAPPGYQMVQVGATTIYTNTIILPAGTPVALSYQYGIDPGGFYGGPAENEASANNVHYRVVRSTKGNPYVMPTDTFSSQPYVEPFFSTGNIGANGSLAGGNLTVGSLSGGTVPVSWLGRPGAYLQTTTNLASGPWQNVLATDGTNWTSGFSSTNGFVSVTNWPSSGNTFFRLVKP